MAGRLSNAWKPTCRPYPDKSNDYGNENEDDLSRVAPTPSTTTSAGVVDMVDGVGKAKEATPADHMRRLFPVVTNEQNPAIALSLVKHGHQPSGTVQRQGTSRDVDELLAVNSGRGGKDGRHESVQLEERRGW